MRVQNESADPIERYLLLLRTALGKTPEAEKNEIVSDIRSHIAERVNESGLATHIAVPQILKTLGTPESLAQTYRTEGLLHRAATTFSPWVLLRAMFQWAFLAFEGFLAFLVVFIGYVAALGFVGVALIKPFFPQQTGMWIRPQFELGALFRGLSPAHELLGYWIIPLSLFFGLSSFILTTRFGRWAIRRFTRQVQPVRARQFCQTAVSSATR